MQEPSAFLNGRYLPASALAISPVDAGFVQGTTIAEQLRTFAGRVFHLDDHLNRLAHSLDVLQIVPGIGLRQLGEVALELIARNHPLMAPGDDLGLSIFVTPGPYAGYSAPGPHEPTVCLHTYPLAFRFWAEKYDAGQSLVVTSVRQVPPECWPASLKCRSRMHYFLADREAGRIEPKARALLLDQQGWVTEASTANVLMVTAGEGLVSPPREVVLQGISLAAAEKLAERLGIPFVHRNLRPDELAGADEVLLSSTPFCLLPVTRLNGRPIASGSPGPIFRQLLAAWNEEVGIDIPAQAKRFAQRV
jgi:branched-subunit amino acid aminotransferase/4-amino-4-deoxychorismate lyase